MRRNIHHPCFKNISRNGAIAHLKDEDVGEYVIRPSSQVRLHAAGGGSEVRTTESPQTVAPVRYCFAFLYCLPALIVAWNMPK